jgi:RNA polymerase sigma factor (sigma-70 family)
MIDDAELLRRYAAERSEPAFAEFVQRHLGLVYAAALRRTNGDQQSAAEVAQRVFTNVARRAAMLARHDALTGWLYTATRNAALNLRRDEQLRRNREHEAGAMNELLADPAPEADWKQLRPVLDQAMDALNGADREAVLLRFFEGRGFGEVGTKLHLTENAARMRVDRALEKLRAQLARRGITSTSAALCVVLANQAGAVAPAGLAASVTTTALVGAAAGGGSLAVFLAFMSTSKSIVVVASLVAVLAVGVAFLQTKSARRSAATLAAVTDERDVLHKRAAMADQVALERPALLAAASPAAVAQVPASAAKSAGAELDHVLASPEARAAYLKRATLTLKTRFDRFFRTAGLTGEQQDRFLKLMMDDAEARLDAMEMRRDAGAFDPEGSTMEREAIERVSAFQRQREDAVAGGLRELLGDKFNLAMESLKTVNERNVVDKLASQLYYTDSPLTAQQADQLVGFLAQNRSLKPDTMGGVPISGELSSRRLALPLSQAMPWMLDMLVGDTVIARAAGVLNATQLAALQTLQAQQVAEMQVLPSRTAKDAGSKPK